MKVLISAIASFILSIGMFAGVAAAATTNTDTSDSTSCTIYTTGSQSYNSCVDNSSQSAQVVCNNDIYVLNDNSQTAGTGGATVTDNGDGGSAVTGSATNTSGNTVQIGAACEAAATTTTPVVTTTTTPTPAVTTPTTTAAPQVVAPVGAVEAGEGGGTHISGLSVVVRRRILG
jgi:hypothetical protein